MKFWGRYSAFGASVALAAGLVDQLFKAWMIGVFDAAPVQKIVLAPFFDLVMAWNCGISYGLLRQDSDAGRWVLVAVSLAAVLALAYWLAQLENRLPALSLGLIIGGAMGMPSTALGSAPSRTSSLFTLARSIGTFSIWRMLQLLRVSRGCFTTRSWPVIKAPENKLSSVSTPGTGPSPCLHCANL